MTHGAGKGACHRALRLTHQDRVEYCISDYEWLHLEGFAERSCLVHSPHGGCFICIDVLPQLLPVKVPSIRTVYSVAPSLASLLSAFQLLSPAVLAPHSLAHSLQQHLLNFGDPSGPTHQDHLLNLLLQREKEC